MLFEWVFRYDPRNNLRPSNSIYFCNRCIIMI
jgi:hypothetical protein